MSGGGKALHIRLGKCKFYKPVLIEDDSRVEKLYPKVAKLRGETYGSAMHVDIHLFTARNMNTPVTKEMIQAGLDRRRNVENVENEKESTEEIEIGPGVMHRVQPRVYLTILPVMLGSRMCRLYGLPNQRLIELGESIHEPGGFFLLRGKERVIIPQKNLGKNTLFITKEDDGVVGTLHACMESVDVSRVVNKITITHDKELHDMAIRFQVNQIFASQKGVPIGVMLAILGMTDWVEVVDTISGFSRIDVTVVTKFMRSCENETIASLEKKDDPSIFTAAWTWLGEHVSAKQRMRTTDPLPAQVDAKRVAAQEVVHHFVLPHVQDGIPAMQSPDDFWAVCRIKALTLCHLVGQTLRVLMKLDEPTDRDRMEHKRYEMPGILMLKLFRTLLRPQLSDFRTQIINMDKNNKPIDIVGAMCSERLQKGIASALQNGKFQLSKRGGGRQSSSSSTAGVSQAITRINPLTHISHLRKTATQGTRKIPAGARQLHPSQWGYQVSLFVYLGKPHLSELLTTKKSAQLRLPRDNRAVL